MLDVILITRLHAMYQQSRKILAFIIVVFLTLTVTCGVYVAKGTALISGEKFVLSGTYQCGYEYEGDALLLMHESWIFRTIWEVFALCLAVWIVVKHFRVLRQSSKRWAIGEYLSILIKTHVLYFIAFAAVSCFNLGYLSPKLSGSFSVGAKIYAGILTITMPMQMFVLGPRLILSIREYHAKDVGNSGEGAGMCTMVFQEGAHVFIDDGV
ncbi:hypothetical protein K503DRAFT_95316 [Rhizopogon vinicolor AM-OR11-026]|uniref:G-protein coupled receptors family 3 profile domain-containing protein n=1 Tax=Rhizopogon vinicolor AM-OR11-026 TaxID=1314800 RepID=A0A1B7N3C4_9AGAM|nr:hypothetical protein K503DRAFT_95316 [Rhizopogon vinicolor AM-OR11-026]